MAAPAEYEFSRRTVACVSQNDARASHAIIFKLASQSYERALSFFNGLFVKKMTEVEQPESSGTPPKKPRLSEEEHKLLLQKLRARKKLLSVKIHIIYFL